MHVAAKRVGVHRAEIPFDAANSQVHHRQSLRCRVGLVPVDRNVADSPAMLFDKLFARREHASRTAARIVDSLLVRREHLGQHVDHAARRVELPAVLPLGIGELREEVFVDAALRIENILRVVLGGVHLVAAAVGGEPELGFKAEIGGGAVQGTGTRSLLLRHIGSPCRFKDAG